MDTEADSTDSTSSADPAGTWHITEMEMWGEGYLNREAQAYIRVGDDGLGDFQFGLVSGSIDGHLEDCGSETRFTFTWEGRDEMDPVSGSGWLRPTEDDQAKGMIKIHKGDRSRFQAQRAS